IKVWDLPQGREVRLFGGLGLLTATLTFSPDGKYLLAGKEDGAVRVWDFATGTVLRDLPAHAAAVSALAFSPRGKVLATGSADTTVLLWDWPRLCNELTAAPGGKAAPLEDLWQALGGADSGAQEALAAAPGAVDFLKGRLKAVAAVDP